jgi:3',5'-cyclic AMP phosphodiesterase CpdA
MNKLLAFTDLHFRASTIIGLDPVARFKEGLEHALAHQGDADGIVFMGDLSHGGTVSEYQILKETLGELPIPATFMLGNHDRREAFLEVFPEAILDHSGFVQSAFDMGEWRIITLDSLDGPPYPKGHHSGLLCSDRLTWLTHQLADAANKPVAVFMHHPLGNVGFPGMDGIKMTNGSDVLALLKAHPKPVHVFAGHVHRTISGSWNGVPYTMYKSPCHQQPFDFEMTNSALAVDEPGAYGLIMFDGPNLIAHSEDFAIARFNHVPDEDVEG